MGVYGYSNYEVIEVLVNADPYAMDYGNGPSTPEEWLQDCLMQSDMDAWTTFSEKYCLTEFSNFNELRVRWEEFEQDFESEAWELPGIDQAIDDEIDNVFQSLLDNFDTDDKFNLIQEKC